VVAFQESRLVRECCYLVPCSVLFVGCYLKFSGSLPPRTSAHVICLQFNHNPGGELLVRACGRTEEEEHC
jgi:hypothetical protein